MLLTSANITILVCSVNLFTIRFLVHCLQIMKQYAQYARLRQNVHKVNELLTFRNFYDEKLKMLLTSPNLGTLVCSDP